MAVKHLGCFLGQRRIDEHRQGRQIAPLDQGVEIDQQLLGALDGEGGNQDHAAGLQGGLDLAGENLAAPFDRARRANDGAVGRFHDDEIKLARSRRRRLERLVAGADVAREQDAEGVAAVADLEFDRGRPEDMAGIPEPRLDAGGGLEPLVVGLRANEAKG